MLTLLLLFNADIIGVRTAIAAYVADTTIVGAAIQVIVVVVVLVVIEVAVIGISNQK